MCLVHMHWVVCVAGSFVCVSFTMDKQSEQVYSLSATEDDKSVELGVFLEAHPGVDVNLHQNKYNGYRAIHATAYLNNVASTRLLVDTRADLEVRCVLGQTPLYCASHLGNNECLQVLIFNVKYYLYPSYL
jgi:hypothetical protein